MLRHLHTWMTEGKAPPSAPPVAMANGVLQQVGIAEAVKQAQALPLP